MGTILLKNALKIKFFKNVNNKKCAKQKFRAVTSPKKQPKHTQDFALRSTDLLHTRCCLTIAKTLLLMSFHSIWSKCTKVIFFPMSPLVQEKVHFVCLSFSKIQSDHISTYIILFFVIPAIALMPSSCFMPFLQK